MLKKMDESGQTRYMYIISKGPFIIVIIIKIYYIQLYIKYYSTIYSSDTMTRKMCKLRMLQECREYTLRKNVQTMHMYFLELGFSYLYKFTNIDTNVDEETRRKIVFNRQFNFSDTNSHKTSSFSYQNHE